MSITIASMIDSLRKRAAPQPLNRSTAHPRPPPGSFLVGITRPAPGSHLVGQDCDSLAIERRIIIYILGLGNDDPFFEKFDQERTSFLAEFKAAGVKSLTIADVMDESKTSIERCKAWADSDKAKFKRCITDYCDHSSLKDEFRSKFVERINMINQQVGLPSIH